MGDVYSYSNNSFLAAAHPSLGATGDPAWDRAFADWMIADGLARADLEFGRTAALTYESDQARVVLEQKYGRNFQAVPDAKAQWAPIWAATLRAEDERCETFLEPMWEAARVLMLTPAPNLAAALFKIELAKREELNGDGEMLKRGDPFELVAADMARLRGGSA